MRTDMKALLKVLGWSFALVLAVLASIGMAVTVTAYEWTLGSDQPREIECKELASALV